MEEVEVSRRIRQEPNPGYISTLYHCATAMATNLCIYDIAEKLKTNGKYDIGGTYTEEEPEFWFYYTTSLCHGYNFLLNLFVLPRKPGCFSLFVPKMNKLSNEIKNDGIKLAVSTGPLTELTFKTTKKDEHVFVKTFQIDVKEVCTLDKCVLLIPMKIQLHSKLQLDPNTVRTIKLQHNLSSLMSQKETTDFTLLSSTNKKYAVHKVLLAAHSPVLRNYLDNRDSYLALDVTDEAMNIILEFLYTGTIRNLYKQNYSMLLEIAEKLQLILLFDLAQQLLSEEINVQNAISIAVIAKQYKLEGLTYKVFDYIKNHPNALTTETWHHLKDIDLVKHLLKHLHPPCHDDGNGYD